MFCQSNFAKVSPKEDESFIEDKKKAEILLPRIGDYILSNLGKLKYLFLDSEGRVLLNENNFLDIALEVLKFLYKEAGLEMPEIFNNCYIENEFSLGNYQNEIVGQITDKLRKVILKDYLKPRTDVEEDLEESLVNLVKKQALPFVYYKDNMVYIGREIIDLLNNEIPSLKILAELLDLKYNPKKDIYIGKKKTSRAFIECSLDDFLRLIFPKV